MKRQRAETREGMIVTTIALSREVHRKLAIAAVEENTALTELMRQAVSEWLHRREKNPKRRRAPP